MASPILKDAPAFDYQSSGAIPFLFKELWFSGVLPVFNRTSLFLSSHSSHCWTCRLETDFHLQRRFRFFVLVKSPLNLTSHHRFSRLQHPLPCRRQNWSTQQAAGREALLLNQPCAGHEWSIVHTKPALSPQSTFTRWTHPHIPDSLVVRMSACHRHVQ